MKPVSIPERFQIESYAFGLGWCTYGYAGRLHGDGGALEAARKLSLTGVNIRVVDRMRHLFHYVPASLPFEGVRS